MIPSLKKNRITVTKNEEYTKAELLKNNFSVIIIYSLFLAIAFSLNAFISSVFVKITGDKPGILYNFIYSIFLIVSILIIFYFTDIKLAL
jgi:hypothetical protein